MDVNYQRHSVNTIKRRSIFTKKEISVSDNSDTYPASYGKSLESEIQQWIQQINPVLEEHRGYDDNASTANVKVKAISERVFSDDELQFFDHSMYHGYLDSVGSFCNKVAAAIELKKNSDIVYDHKKAKLQKMLKQVDEQIKSHFLN